MEGVIVNFKGSEKHKYGDYMIVKVPNIKNKEETTSLLDKSVSWKSPAGKEIKGKIYKAHGNKGAVRVKFEKGMPGQAIGSKVEIQ